MSNCLNTLAIANDNVKICSYSYMSFELKNGLILIEASINDVAGTYIFDTGLEGVLINGSPNKTDQIFETVGGSVEAEEINIDKLRVGNLVINDLKAYQTDLTIVSNFTSTNIKGMIGLSILNEMLISINYKDKIIKLLPKVKNIDRVTEHKQVLDIIMQQEIPCLEMVHNGTKHLFALDSGASSNFIDFNLLGLTSKSIKTSSVISLKGTETIKKTTQIQLGLNKSIRHQLQCQNIDLAEINNQLDKPIVGILSSNAVFPSEIFIDMSNSKLYF